MNFEFEKRISEVEYYFFCLLQLYKFDEQKQSIPLKNKMKSDTHDFFRFFDYLESKLVCSTI